MKRYSVQLPISGYVIKEVEADNATDAIKKALRESNFDRSEIEEWEVHERITRGNVCYALCNDANAEEIAADEDA